MNEVMRERSESEKEGKVQEHLFKCYRYGDMTERGPAIFIYIFFSLLVA